VVGSIFFLLLFFQNQLTQNMKFSVFALAVLALVFTSSVLGSKPTPDIAPTHAGFINVSPQDGAFLYYYFLESQNDPSTDPVFLWLQGGPGCSSLFGLFVENGPQIVDANGNFSPNLYGWTTNASMLWIDSPVGTGYSYVQNGDYARNEQTVSADLYTALYTFFFELYPQYSQNDFYVFGESYGGKYVPWLASTIITENGNAQNAINLKGIGMGDGWTDVSLLHSFFHSLSYHLAHSQFHSPSSKLEPTLLS
jgi:carboxypeptidase C (cathepsin A)